jgi:hypothetical protein
MLKNLFFLASLASLLCCFASCGPDRLCSPNLINPVFVGYSLSDIDTLLLRRYKANDSFNILIDTMTFVSPSTGINGPNYGVYRTSNDTTFVDINVKADYTPISYGYDWELYIPAKNRTVSISAITNTQNTGNKGCGNPITSFVQDGQLIGAPTFFGLDEESGTSGYRAYIH